MKLLSEKYSKNLEVLGNAERIRILELLSEKDLCVHEINSHFFASQATISYHLSLLREIGFVRTEKRGKYISYSLASSSIKKYLKEFVRDFSRSLSRA